MPKVIGHETKPVRVASSTGVYYIRPKQERTIPSELYPQALAQGCRPADNSADASASVTPRPATTAEVRVVVRDLMKEGDPTKFTDGGRPKVAAVREQMGEGINVGTKIVNEVFDELTGADEHSK